jgi:hypothetical protein
LHIALQNAAAADDADAAAVMVLQGIGCICAVGGADPLGLLWLVQVTKAD